jgi:hypothetical protein
MKWHCAVPLDVHVKSYVTSLQMKWAQWPVACCDNTRMATVFSFAAPNVWGVTLCSHELLLAPQTSRLAEAVQLLNYVVEGAYPDTEFPCFSSASAGEWRHITFKYYTTTSLLHLCLSSYITYQPVRIEELKKTTKNLQSVYSFPGRNSNRVPADRQPSSSGFVWRSILQFTQRIETCTQIKSGYSPSNTDRRHNWSYWPVSCVTKKSEQNINSSSCMV